MDCSLANVLGRGDASRTAGAECSVGLITVRLCGAEMIEITRRGSAGGLPRRRQILWGAEEIGAAYAATLKRRDRDGLDQQRALRWAMDRMEIDLDKGKARR